MCIVMVTNLKEGTKSKCEQYWPDTVMDQKEFGPFTVTLMDEQVMPDTVTRKLSVKVSQSKIFSSNSFFSYQEIHILLITII